MNLDRELLAFARRHNGLVTVDAWCAGGRTRRSFDRACASGVLVSLAPRVAALAGTTVGSVQRIHAAALASPVAVLVSHRSAAHLWGATIIGDRPVDLLRVDGGSASRREQVVIHRPKDRLDLGSAVRRGIEVTLPVRTLIDLGAVAPAAVPETLESLLVSGLVTVRGVRRSLDRHRGRGRRGVRALDAALDGLALGAKTPDSTLEPLMARLFQRHAITGWTFHAVVAGFEVDFAFERERVVVEVDGFAFHADRQAFERDRARDAALASKGWVVVRFTWPQVTQRPADVANRLAATLGARSVSGPRHRRL